MVDVVADALAKSWGGNRKVDDTTAGQFAELMLSREGRMDADDALTWFSLVHDAGTFPLRNATYYSFPKNYPLAESYPQMPPALFQKPPSSEAIAWLQQLLDPGSEVSATEELVKRQEQYIWRHTLIVDLRGLEMIAVGEDENKTGARTAACMHLLQQLHESNVLHDLALADLSDVDQALATAEAKAPDHMVKLHVYNYAARFGLLPKIRSKQLLAGKVETTVSLQQLGIQVAANGPSEVEAELAACALFKQAAEARQAAISSDQLVLRGSTAVNLDNASNILRYYTFLHSADNFIHKVQQEDPLDPDSRFSAWVSRNGKLVAPPVTMPDSRKAQILATLVAATSLVSEDPDLLISFHKAVEQNNGVVPTATPTTPIALGAAEPFLQELSTVLDVVKVPEYVVRPAKPSHHVESVQRSQMILARGRRHTDSYHSTTQSLEDRSEQLRLELESRRNNMYLQDKRDLDSRLPINEYRDELLALVKNNAQCIVVGTSGSGKSTQLPQILLDDAITDGQGASCNIYHTLPRRSTAVSLAHRIASERDENVGETVGYWISGDRRQCDLGGSINFCTSELLHIQLQYTRDEFLDHASHIIIDEVHERDGPTNRLLMLIKLAFAARLKRGASVPKLILMSATLQSGLFERYFELTDEAGTSLTPPVLTIPGRQYPISDKYLGSVMQDIENNFSRTELEPVLQHPFTRDYLESELGNDQMTVRDVESPQVARPVDWESQLEINMKSHEQNQAVGLVALAIANVVRSTTDGDIIAFLTSWKDIHAVQSLLCESSFMGLDFTDTTKFKFLWIHSMYPDSVPEAMEPGREGCRRILLATNTAETSLTFPEVKYVIDSGKRRALEYDAANAMSVTLHRRWVSKASATQRAGRIGRVQPGEYHALFTEARLESMSPFQEAAAEYSGMVQQLCLNARLHFPSLTIHQYFARMIDPPPHRNLEAAIKQLQSVGAMSDGEQLTDLGQMLARMQRSPRVGRMLLLAILFRCLDPILAVSALTDAKVDIMHYIAHDKEGQAAIDETRRRYDRGSMSDFIVDLNLLNDFRTTRDQQGLEVAREWAVRNHMRTQTLEDLDRRAENYRQILFALDCMSEDDRTEPARLNTRSGNIGLIKALIMVGMYPNIGVHARNHLFHTSQTVRPAHLWPGSLTRPIFWQPASQDENPLHHSLCTYTESRSLYVDRDMFQLKKTSPVSSLAAVFFAQSVHMKPDDETTLIVDNWLPLQISGSPTAAQTVLKIKRQLDHALGVALQRLCNPKLRRQGNTRALEVMIRTVADLLEHEEKKWRRRMDELDQPA
jgi:ATP-dependent RNA helicase DHX36